MYEYSGRSKARNQQLEMAYAATGGDEQFCLFGSTGSLSIVKLKTYGFFITFFYFTFVYYRFGVYPCRRYSVHVSSKKNQPLLRLSYGNFHEKSISMGFCTTLFSKIAVGAGHIYFRSELIASFNRYYRKCKYAFWTFASA